MKKHNVTVSITQENLHDQIIAAIEVGSRYWAKVDVGKHQANYANYFKASFTVHEVSDEKKGAIQGKSYKLSITKLRAGLVVLATKYPHHFGDILRQSGDAITGDVLVQCALFCDIVYG